jgi:hypothetical protein
MIFSCLHSMFIQCRFNPITIKLSSLPCLSELLRTESSSMSQCQASKSRHFQNGVLNEKSLVSLSLINITDRLVSIHQTAIRRTFMQLQMEVYNNKTMINRFVDDFISSIISVLLLFLLSIVFIVVRYIRKTTITKIEEHLTEINRL